MGTKTRNRLGISVDEFARRENVSNTLVHAAIRNDRLKSHPDGSVDPALVGSPWRRGNIKAAEARSGSSVAAAKGQGLDYSEAIRLKENYLALLRRLEYEEKSGSLIELAVAEAVLFDAFRAQRDALLNWPTRIGPMLAADLDLEVDRVVIALTAYVHKHISELGEPQADFNRT